MALDRGDAIDLLGRFGIFWAFVLKRPFRRMVLNAWRQESRPMRLLSLLEGAGNAFIGLLPLAALGLALWWVV